MTKTCAVSIARSAKPRIIMAKVVNVDDYGMITGGGRPLALRGLLRGDFGGASCTRPFLAGRDLVA